MTDSTLIRRIEELSLNAWPAAQTLLDDGWVLRFGNGYTRRANAIYPLYTGSRPLEEKLRACEALYASQGQPTIFKVTEASQPAGLDAALAARGYQTDAQTGVQLLDLRHREWVPPRDVTLSETMDADWLSAYARMSGLIKAEKLAHEKILTAILPARRFAAIRVEGEIIACGLAVMQAGWVGFYDIRTDPAFRRQGHAYGVMVALLAWAKSSGALDAYLQVMLNNPPALNLYARLGFQQAYHYWYRAKA